MGLPQAKLTATEARLAALAMPVQAGWTRPLRDAALARVQQMGLPGRRDEYWRFTRPDELNSAAPVPAGVRPPAENATFEELDRVRIVFVDGVFDPEASDDPAQAGLEISRLAEAEGQDLSWAADLYGTLEARGQTPVPRPLAALNTAFATDGVLIRATGRVGKPVNLVYRHCDETSDAILHHVIRVESGADLTVLETGPAAARFNKVMEVDVADGGAFHHVRSQGRDHDRRAATHIFARLGEESIFKSFTLTMNGALTRNEVVIELTGDEGVAHVAGACMGDGAFHHDDTVFITHDAVNCESRQVFKKVLRKGATGVFQGKILVKEGAQKTDGYQISQSLLLDEEANFLAKPELEIYADDVACSHGSTSGAIDEDALFYLRSRGVPKAEAQDMMVLSFLAEAIEEIESEAVRDEVSASLAAWLERHRR
ncbi:Fe-S cluster assembly protein SufD [Rhodovulum sulfidophilum]|uniref:Fe-S cluster assembly protein SufD n=1 Tax=Rhodovulum sulfidophilum TaxID=35806 RepID=UPI00192487F7|nr:Fe-S cluster assembly protein SufD [Rhodovulum sulfidophilum]MBL3564772.1 Fe-S cluster assembly protein SufD [Rhodovulum sulfidophilum]